MPRIQLLAFLLCAILCFPAYAQKRKKTSPAPPALSAEQLIQQYRFSEATAQLTRDLQAARKANRMTDLIETDLSRARLGSDLLQGVERITFVDSVKVSCSKMLQAVPLSTENGSVKLMSGVSETVANLPARVGEGCYINELGDRLLFSATDSADAPLTLWTAWKSAERWGKPAQVAGFQETDMDIDYPFLLPDGVTLYYAAQGEGSLGGYDLFRTRYDAQTKSYLKAENLGMPFNSPANDYFLILDEDAAVGWLATDRNQQGDTVCVYTFIYSTTRDFYDAAQLSATELQHFASIHSIAETQGDTVAVNEALSRIEALQSPRAVQTAKTSRYVINDGCVYTSLSQFRSETARRIAEQAEAVKSQLDSMEQEQDALQRQVALSGRDAKAIARLKQLSEQLPELKAQYATLCKNMRTAETR